MSSQLHTEEEYAPRNGDQLAAAAGALLFGKSLIIGAGRCVAARTCLLHDPSAKITIVEKYSMFLNYVPENVNYIYMDVHNFYPSTKYENVFIDVFPEIEHPRVLKRLADCVVEAGRLLCLDYYEPKDFGSDWKTVLEFAPSPFVSNKLLVLRRKHIG